MKPQGWKFTRRNHALIGLISLPTNLRGRTTMIDDGQRKATYPNYLEPHLASTSEPDMWTNFFTTKILKKLDYWSTMKLSLASMVVISNHVLLSTLWFFIIVCGGTNKILAKIISVICNYLWYGKEQFTHTRVSWKECCFKK